MLKYLAIIFIFLIASCTSLNDNLNDKGILFSDVKTSTNHPKQNSTTEVGNTITKSCTHQLLHLIAWGDNGIISVAKNAGIKEILTVDKQTTDILLGTYARKCIIIAGK